METLEFLGWIFALTAGFLVVIGLLLAMALKHIQARALKDVEEVMAELETKKLIALTVEVAGDQFLCYNATDMTFVCQGRDLKEIRDRFRSRYPDKNAAIYNGDTEAVQLLKQQLKELRENSNSI